MELLFPPASQGKRIEAIYGPDEDGLEIFVRGPESLISDALEFAEQSHRPRAYYLRRLARRKANSIGFTGADPGR